MTGNDYRRASGGGQAGWEVGEATEMCWGWRDGPSEGAEEGTGKFCQAP